MDLYIYFYFNLIIGNRILGHAFCDVGPCDRITGFAMENTALCQTKLIMFQINR